jgi:hypothetical protein
MSKKAICISVLALFCAVPTATTAQVPGMGGIPMVGGQSTGALGGILQEEKEKICTLEGIPRVDSGDGYAPVDREDRALLYARCEVTKEIVPGRPLSGRSCCEHLTKADSHAFNVCKDGPIGGAAKIWLKKTVKCKG